tara:strand:+ start:311 stop:499 length:189 start_codon:yes stop_codon:yes gene_type:complete
MNHFANNGKEYLRKDKDNEIDHERFEYQGKSKKQYMDSFKFFLISALGFFITFIVVWLINNL